jgi:hypothetical protein
VNVEEWRPLVGTRLTSSGRLPVGDPVCRTRDHAARHLPPNAKPRDITHVKPEHPHWPLVVMTVLTQMSVGAFTTIWLLQLLGARRGWRLPRSRPSLVAALALSASTLHLGRPIHAYAALRMWRRSWLSREVLLFTSFFWRGRRFIAAALWFWRCSGPVTTRVGA